MHGNRTCELQDFWEHPFPKTGQGVEQLTRQPSCFMRIYVFIAANGPFVFSHPQRILYASPAFGLGGGGSKKGAHFIERTYAPDKVVTTLLLECVRVEKVHPLSLWSP